MSPHSKSVTFKDVESIDYFHTETKICRLVQEIFGPYSVGYRDQDSSEIKTISWVYFACISFIRLSEVQLSSVTTCELQLEPTLDMSER